MFGKIYDWFFKVFILLILLSFTSDCIVNGHRIFSIVACSVWILMVASIIAVDVSDYLYDNRKIDSQKRLKVFIVIPIVSACLGFAALCFSVVIGIYVLAALSAIWLAVCVTIIAFLRRRIINEPPGKMLAETTDSCALSKDSSRALGLFALVAPFVPFAALICYCISVKLGWWVGAVLFAVGFVLIKFVMAKVFRKV